MIWDSLTENRDISKLIEGSEKRILWVRGSVQEKKCPTLISLPKLVLSLAN